MTQISDFINQLPDLLGVFLLMLSTFLIGYFASYATQKAKYAKILKGLSRKDNYKALTKKEKDIDVIFTEIKPKIIEVVKKTQEEFQKETTPPTPTEQIQAPQDVAERARTSYVTYTRNKPKLNFDNFGAATQRSSQDLTKINGIGPYIEQKLNEIGIYNYEQISKFKDEDIRVLTELIDFFPGRIDRDNWVEQAGELQN